MILVQKNAQTMLGGPEMRKVLIPHKPEVEGSSPSLDTIQINQNFLFLHHFFFNTIF